MHNNTQSELRRAYRRASIGLAIAAVVWTVAYFVARDRGWSEMTIVIPVGAAALSALCYRRYRKMEEEHMRGERGRGGAGEND